MTYILSFPLSGFFKAAHWPLLRTYQSGGNFVQSMYRIVFFNALVGSLVMAVSASLVNILNGPISIVKDSVIISLLLVALGRILGMIHFEDLIDEIYILVLGVFGAFVYIWLSNVPRLTIILNSISPDIVLFYGVGILIVSVFIEVFWLFRQLRPSSMTYHHFRKYYESQETYQMADFRGSVVNAFIDTIDDCAKESRIEQFYWKTWSGEEKIARALRDAVARQIYQDEFVRTRHGDGQTLIYFRDLPDEEKDRCRNLAREHLKYLHKEQKAFVFIPMNEDTGKIVRSLSYILGFEPTPIPSVGIKRYLILNRHDIVLSLPIPVEPINGEYHSDTRSNLAIATHDPTRVHECLREFE
ncbi:MAG: hypothetical protein K8F24_11075, partial [Bacteroidales bacterium]|nr:hypothetical protein [Bacteroidales bacterium]